VQLSTLPKYSHHQQVQPITVASQEYAAGTQALMTGWGKTSGGKKCRRHQFICISDHKSGSALVPVVLPIDKQAFVSKM